MEDTVIEIAQALFLENGLRDTEMKQIAERTGISRSTLYRLFPSKDVLAFHVAQRFLREIFSERQMELPQKDAAGFEVLREYIHRLIDDLVEHVGYLKYLLEFDQVFAGSYPDIPQTSQYIAFNRNNREMLHTLIQRGIDDGSIRGEKGAGLLELSIGNAVLAISERILSREEHYLEEYGIGRELVSQVMDMILDSIHRC